MNRKTKVFFTIFISCFLAMSDFIPPMGIYATEQIEEEENINASFTQAYDQKNNKVDIHICATASEMYEIVAVSLKDEQKIGAETNFIITNNGEYTFTVHFKKKSVGEEASSQEEKTKEFVIEVTAIINKDSIADANEENKELLNKDTTVDAKEESQEVVDKETPKKELNQLETPIQGGIANKGFKNIALETEATPTKYFIFEKPNTITSYTSPEGAPKDIVIPRTYVDEYNVEQEILYIDNNAFAGQQLTSVIFNDNLMKIGDYAFYNNQDLTDVIIPDNIESIGNGAFQNCTSLVNLHIGKGLQALPNNVFNQCTSLKRVTIPENIKSLGVNSFNGCSNLKNVTIEYGLESIENGAFSETGIEKINLPESLKTLGDAFHRTKLTSIIIPDSVKGNLNLDSVFSECELLTDFTIGSGITSVTKYFFNSNFKYRVPSKEYGDLPGFTYGKSGTFGDNVYWKSSDDSCFYENKGIVYGFKQIDHETHQNCLQHGDHTYVNIDNALFNQSITSISDNAFYGPKLTSVTLPDTVETIQAYAFYKTTNLKSIDLPNSLLFIGSQAFCESGIESIKIPDKITSIEANTFSRCPNLVSVILGNAIQSIGDSAFSGSKKLETIKMGKSVETIGNAAFTYTSLKKIDFPNRLKTIGSFAFSYCSQLTEVNFGSGLQTIGEGAFSASRLIQLVIPNSVTSMGNSAFEGSSKLKALELGSGLLTIPYASFRKCPLTDVEFAEGVTTISSFAFEGNNIKNLKLPNSLQVLEQGAFQKGFIETVDFGTEVTSIASSVFYMNRIKKIVLPDSLTSIGKFTFAENPIDDITIGSSLNDLPSDLLSNTADGIKIRIPSKYVNDILGTPWGGKNAQIYWKSNDASCYYEKDGILYGFKPLDHESHTNCKQNGHHTYIDLSSENFTQPITRIEDGAFTDNTSINKVIFSNQLESIGNNAFFGCTKLNELDMKEGLLTIGENAFENTNLSSKISIPDSVTTIGLYAFDNTKLTDITIGSGVQELGEIFRGVSGIKIRIPSKEVNDIAKAPWGAKQETTDIYWKSNDDSCLYIKEGKVYGIKPKDHETHKDCTQNAYHTRIEIPSESNGKAVTEIVDKAFKSGARYADLLTKVMIPGSVKIIGANAFEGLENLKEIELGEGIEVIKPAAFYGLDRLESIVIPDSMIEIQAQAFQSCNNLKQLDFGKGVRILGKYVANYSGVESIVIPDSVETIGEYAFNYCESLKNLTIGSGLKNIEEHTFSKAVNLNNVTIPENVEEIGYAAFYGCKSLTNLTFSEGLKKIESIGWESTGERGAFQSTGITSIELPNSLLNIGKYTFSYCYGLNSIAFGNSLKKIEKEAFLNDVKLNDVVLPDNIEMVDSSAFEGCKELKNIQMSKNLKTIASEAFRSSGVETASFSNKINEIQSSSFADCNNLIEVSIDNANVKIGNSAFKNGKNLKNANLGDNVVSIEAFAFDDCINLQTVHIGNTVTTIGQSVFRNTNLESFIVPASVTNIGSSILENTKSLKSLIIKEGVKHLNYSSNLLAGSSLESIELPSTILTINSNTFLASNLKQIYVNQLRDGCSFKVNQPWGATKAKVLYRGEYIEVTPNVSYNDIFSKATITVDFKAEINGYIKSVKLPDGRIIENIDRETFTINHDVFVNGTYTFFVTSSFDNTREVSVVVDKLNPIHLTAQDASMKKRDVSSLTIDKILTLTNAEGWLITGNNLDAPITKELKVDIKAPMLENIKKALLAEGSCEITLYTEGILIEGGNKLQAEIKVKLTANEIYTIKFIAGEHGNLAGTQTFEVLKGTNLSDITAPTVKADKGWTFTKWDPTFESNSSVNEDMVFTAQYEKEQTMWKTVRFQAGEHGNLAGTQTFEVLKGTNLSDITAPTVKADKGWTFTKWDPTFESNSSVNEDMVFTAQYEKEQTMWKTVKFQAGEHGNLAGTQTFEVLKGTNLSDITAPTVKADKGWTFTNWSPTFIDNARVDENMTFIAQYKNENIEKPSIPLIPIVPEYPTPPSNSILPATPIKPTLPEQSSSNPSIVIPNEKESIEKPDISNSNRYGEERVVENETPLAKTNTDKWALVNLICMTVTTLLEVILLLLRVKKEEKQDEVLLTKRRRWLKVIGFVVSMASITMFLLTENMSLQMAWVDKWTKWMVAITSIQMIVLGFGLLWKKTKDEKPASYSNTQNRRK